MKEKIIIKYGELWLKSEPVRRRFIRTLADNISRQMKSHGIKNFSLERTRDMLILESKSKKSLEVLKKVFGISWFSVAEETRPDMKAIGKAVLGLAKKIGKDQTFAIRASRHDKAFAFTSKDIENRMGAKIRRKVNLSKPDVTIFIELKKDRAYVYSEKIKGAGGLPVGVSGRALSLVSGGIDSPVSSWLMMKRGCTVDFMHFCSYEGDVGKIKNILKKLGEYAPEHLNLYVVPFKKMQEEIAKNCERRLMCVLCKRLMYRTADALAARTNAKAIVTGENLGQVASQTLDNLLANTGAVSIPLLRPLITMDKEETISLAKRIGTYDISIKSAKPCRFVPSKPATNAKSFVVASEEKRLKNLNKIIEKVISGSKKVVV